jgi:hypothetical protein
MSNDDLPAGLLAYMTPEGKRGAIDPESITAIHEIEPVMVSAPGITGQHPMDPVSMSACMIYVGNHAHKVLGSIEEWLRAIVGDDESVEVTEEGKQAIETAMGADGKPKVN